MLFEFPVTDVYLGSFGIYIHFSLPSITPRCATMRGLLKVFSSLYNLLGDVSTIVSLKIIFSNFKLKVSQDEPLAKEHVNVMEN